MKIYFAAVGSETMGCIDRMKSPRILFSYYDITTCPIPFRKKSWDIIKKEKENANRKK